MRLSKPTSLLKTFARREDGTIAMEAMIVLPAMFWAFLVCFSIFDTFRMYNINQKAAYTIGDAISRETVPLDAAYLAGMHQMFEYLSSSNGSASLRVSAMQWSQTDDRYYSLWSQAIGGQSPLTESDVIAMRTRLPVMPDAEVVTLVETWTEYDPPFKTGLEEQEIRNFIFTRPRFAPQVCWESCPVVATEDGTTEGS